MGVGGSIARKIERLRERSRLRQLRDEAAARRFEALRSRYAYVAQALSVRGGARSDGGSAYAWSTWEREIHDAFRDGVPPDFLSHPRISGTMVVQPSRHLADRVDRVVETFGATRARLLLREDAVGEPRLPEDAFLTSANRAHHAYHLANYRRRTGRDPWSCGGVVEWGGGYGDMARLMRLASPGLTYLIIDLAPLLALQWVYLATLEGPEALHLITAAAPAAAPGKVNLVESALVMEGTFRPDADLFLSTWAATESPPPAQAVLAENRFFGARRLLVAYLKDPSNRLLDAVAAAGCDRVPVEALAAEGHADHEYAFL